MKLLVAEHDGLAADYNALNEHLSVSVEGWRVRAEAAEKDADALARALEDGPSEMMMDWTLINGALEASRGGCFWASLGTGLR